MRIGITGNQGFIGKNLVVALTNKKYKLSFFDLPQNDLLNPKKNYLKKFVSNNDVIIHTAAVNRGSDTEIIAGSIVAAQNLISAMEKYGSKAKLIFLSSSQAENETIFGMSKKLTEIMLEDFSKRNKSPVAIFRLTNVFGEGCKPFYNSVVATFCYQVANNQKLMVKNGSKEFNFIYIEDVVKILIKEISARRKKPFYFKRVSSKNIISIQKLAKLTQTFKSLENPGKLRNRFYKDLYNTYLFYAKPCRRN